ncbi:MAG: hypothetical protein ABR556_14050, partial [Pyrinomonadaceae bacterium]
VISKPDITKKGKWLLSGNTLRLDRSERRLRALTFPVNSTRSTVTPVMATSNTGRHSFNPRLGLG